MKSAEGKFIVVSNAEPYKHEEGKDDEPVCKEVEGGLTTAMNPQMRDSGGVWIAYGRGEKDFSVTDPDGKVKVPDYPEIPEEDKYTLKRLNFPDSQYRNFYRGYANRILWPIFHSFPTKADLRKEYTYWNEGYLPSNKKYAKAIIHAYQPGDTVWVHDYHLALVPKLVRNELPEAEIGLFWHIPWPPWESFGKLPHREEILKGLAAADLIGLHLENYADNLLECAERVGADLDRGAKRFQLDGEDTQVGAYPLGVDYRFFDGTDTEGKEADIRAKYNCDNLILGVDRQDYTKGIPERIRAFEKFIEDNPGLREEVTLIQRTPPSRTGIEEYQVEKSKINDQVSEFNGKFGTHDWTPIQLFWKGVPQRELIAEYRAADIGLVTPGLDGMNLVAKEFVAANEEPKVLILSEFAGSSRQLEEALLVNPYDPDQVAEAIKEGLRMPREEKERRWRRLRKKVRTEDLPSWAESFLKDLENARQLHSMTRFSFPESEPERGLS
ncbi:trehalose-6-phosphate synthase [Candidatus Bipolaricaulota bacterium]|nr:trehalose-6-phosphate synthase [Candidatus Bipolaricaulota bacterium]MBS3792006.1 trehalose-6-phosphate synthase [Candidatus Bipolaricaulota bacterium]